MVCIYCRSNTQVTNSRKKARQPLVWRRRQCEVCVAQFTTHELPDYSTALVIEQNGRLSPFHRDKLFLSIHFACSHRDDAQPAATILTSTILGTLSRKKLVPEGKLTAQALTQVVYQTLRRFDKNAAATYKAHHLSLL